MKGNNELCGELLERESGTDFTGIEREQAVAEKTGDTRNARWKLGPLLVVTCLAF
jgi:hypothetical protein